MALFDDAARFESCIVIGDTVIHSKKATREHIGPGTYSPALYDSKEFGNIGVSVSRRSNMDPPTSSRSSEFERLSNRYVLRNGVLFHVSPFLSTSPGPGSYAPPIFSSTVSRSTTAKPSSGRTGRQAWDLRGSAGGVSNVCLRDGHTVSSSMGDTPRMCDLSRATLRGEMLVLSVTKDSYRTKGIGPGAYERSNEDSMIKRSHNVRAQNSQVRRRRSLSFSGTSSSAKAHLSLQSPRALQGTDDGRPDLHQLARRTPPAGSSGGPTRSISPAFAMLTSMHARAVADAALDRMTTRRARPRSASPKRTRVASPMALLFPSSVCYTWGGEKHDPTGSVGQSTARECRSLSPSPTEKKPSNSKVAKHDGRDLQRPFTSAQARKAMRATSLSPRSHKALQWDPSYPQGGRRVMIGALSKATSAPNRKVESFGFDYFGPAGRNKASLSPGVISPATIPSGVEDEDPGKTSGRSVKAAAMEKENKGLSGRGNIPQSPPLPPRPEKNMEGGCNAHHDII